MHYNRLVVTVFAFFLLVGLSSAATSYHVSNVNPDQVPPTSSFYISVNLENTGSSEAQNVKVRLVSDNSLIVSTGTLKRIGDLDEDAGITLSFPLNTKGAPTGTYELTLEVSDRSGSTEIDFDIEVTDAGTYYGDSGSSGPSGGSSDDDDDDINEEKDCDKDFKLLGPSLLNEVDHEINPSDRVELVIYLKSLAEYKLKNIVATIDEDVWKVSADGKWYFYDFLTEGTSRPGYFIVNTDNAKPGDYELGLNVEYEKDDNDCEQELKFNITVKGSYGVLIDLKPDSTGLTPDSTIEFSANVRNTGGKEDTYSLTFFEGVSDWVHSAPSEVELAPGEETTVPVTLYIPKVTGSYQIGINAISNTLSSVRDSDITYFTVAEVDKPVHRIGMGSLKETFDVSPCETKSVGLAIDNLGNVAEDVKVVVDGPYWVFVAPSEFQLLPSEKRDITIYFAPDCNEEMGTQNIGVRAYTKKSTASVEGTIGVYVTGGVPDKEVEPEPVAPTGLVPVVVEGGSGWGWWPWLLLFLLALALIFIIYWVEKEEIVI